MVERGDARGRGRELWEGKGRVVVKRKGRGGW